MRRATAAYLLLVSLLCSCIAHAQWVNQQIDLTPGWNAVFLEVEPYPPETAAQFEGKPVAGVWSFDQEFEPAQFVVDPNQLNDSSIGWRVFVPEHLPGAVATNLHVLDTAQPYLIEATQAFTWEVVGRPLLRRQTWNPGRYNLVGLHVDPDSPPTLAQYFAPSPAHAPVDAWTFGQDGLWSRVDNPASTTVQPGRPYWVYCSSASDYQGPVEIGLGSAELFYPEYATELELEIRHHGGGTRQVHVNALTSAQPPAPVVGLPVSPLAGPVPLNYSRIGFTDGPGMFDHDALPASITFLPGANHRFPLVLSVERASMEPATPGSLFQGVIEITNNSGFRRLLAVSADGPGTRAPVLPPTVRSRQLAAGQTSHATGAGLWVGYVTLNQVSEPDAVPPVLTSTPAEFTFRLIVHVDSMGTAKLLNGVTELWRNGVTMADPNNPGEEIIVEAGRTVLMTDAAPALLRNQIGDALVGSTLRDGRHFANRLATPAFSLRDENGALFDAMMEGQGAFGHGNSRLRASITMQDNDPVNPFHHKHHELHGYTNPAHTPVPGQAWYVRREIELIFTDNPTDGPRPAGWGDRVIGGVYEEAMLGLRDRYSPGTSAGQDHPILVRGNFQLERVSRVAVLNDGL